MITLPNLEEFDGRKALSVLRSGTRKPKVDDAVLSGFLNPRIAGDLAMSLRSGLAPVAAPAPEEQEPKGEAMDKELSERVETRVQKKAEDADKAKATFEFNRVDGQTRSVSINVNGKTKTLTINRDEDGNVVSATL